MSRRPPGNHNGDPPPSEAHSAGGLALMFFIGVTIVATLFPHKRATRPPTYPVVESATLVSLGARIDLADEDFSERRYYAAENRYRRVIRQVEEALRFQTKIREPDDERFLALECMLQTATVKYRIAGLGRRLQENRAGKSSRAYP